MRTPFHIVVVEPLPEWVRSFYTPELLPDNFSLHWLDEGAVTEGLETIGGADVIVTGKQRITAAMINAAGPILKLIQVQGRAPWAVDLDAAIAAKVPVSFMPHRGAIAVAEHTLALALGVYRKLIPGHLQTVSAAYKDLGMEPVLTDERTIAFNWMRFDDLSELYGKVLGLVGLGDIGLEVARRARSFDMEVLYMKRTPIPPEFEKILRLRYVSLEVIVTQSDILSLHAPHTPQTESIIGANQLAAMKPTAVLINTSRGGLIDEDALAACLGKREIAGAGLDVFRMEPLPTGHPLMGLDNVLLAPHVGGGGGGGQKGMASDVITNITRVAQGLQAEHLFEPTERAVWL
ncbi:MAG: D-glycerate dehydrogenase [Acidobacteria bacterium]|nr:D-glycerate dehydrogenase [Acidobacteriota bacterium]